MTIAVRNIVIVFPLLLLATGVFAQQAGRVRGKLTDTVGHEILQGALITLTSTSDSLFIKRSFSKEDASFDVHPLPFGKYTVQITFQGFEPLLQVIHLDKQNSTVDMGMLNLKILVSKLDSVHVEGPAVMVKKDTIIYNASHWNTTPYAPVADLLEKLPGVKVNSDGSLTVNGQPVNQILVDGKPFFNGDPKMALEHLPAEIVKQIQVYQTTDERSSRLGISSGPSGSKTLNLVLKINRQSGEFGKAGAGAGPDGVYAAVLDFHHMNGNQQLSVVADGGNVNGFNSDKAGVQIPTSTEYGINKQWNGGINYRDTWNDHTDVNGSYMSSQQHIQDARQIHTLNVFPGDSSTIINQQSNNYTETGRQQFNVMAENKINEFNSLIIRPKVIIQHTENQASGQSTQTNGQQSTMYKSAQNSSSTSNTKTAFADILYMHKNKQQSGSFSAGLVVNGNQSNRNSVNTSNTNYFVPAPAAVSFNQHVVNTQTFLNLSPSLTYTIPIAKKGDVLDLQTNYVYNSSNSSNQAFRYNEATHEFDLRDSLQSNDFNTVYNTAKALASYRLQRNLYSIVLGAGIESDDLQGKSLRDNSTVKSRFTSFLPSADLIFRKNGKSIQISYNGKPVALSPLQLQPVTTTADSLFIQQGNPHLKQPFTHSFTFSYSSINTGSQRFFTAMINGSTTVNAIQNSVVLLNNGARVFTPVNMNGTTNIYATSNFTMPLILQRSDLGIAGNIQYSSDPLVSNGLKINTTMFNISGGISWNYNTQKGLTFDINAVSAYNMVRYAQERDQSNDYFTETLSSRIMYVMKDYSFSLAEGYFWNNNLAQGYQPKAPILSLALSRRFFKRKEAEVKFSITDLLNQQSGALRTVTANSITDMSAMTRGRYAMLSFIYNVSRFKTGKQNKPHL